MRAASLDRRVRKEAGWLVREARTALSLKKKLKGKAGDLEEVTAAVEAALSERDLARVRHHLPVLDALVDELVQQPKRSKGRDQMMSLFTAVLIALALRAVVVEAFKIPSSSMYPTLEINDHLFVNKFIYGVTVPLTDVKILPRSPSRGEVIVFKYPCNKDKDYIKRVVATAGDTVEVRCNVLFINGQAISDKLVEADLKYEDRDENTEKWEWKPVSRYRASLGGYTFDMFHEAQRAHEPPTPRLQTDFPRRGDPLPSCKLGDPAKGTLVETKPEAEPCEAQYHYVVPAGHVFAMGDNRNNSNDSRFWGPVPIENIKGKAMFIWLSYRRITPSGIRWDRIGNFVH